MRRLFLPSGLLPREESDGKAAQRAAGLFRLRSRASKRLFGLVWDHQLLLLGPRLGTNWIKARSQVSSGWLTVACLHSRISRTSTPC